MLRYVTLPDIADSPLLPKSRTVLRRHTIPESEPNFFFFCKLHHIHKPNTEGIAKKKKGYNGHNPNLIKSKAAPMNTCDCAILAFYYN